MKKIKKFLRRCRRFVEKFWAYKGWMWRDGDYDYEWLLQLLSIKLDRMEAFFRSDKPNLERTPITAQQVGLAAELVHRLLHDDYLLHTDTSSLPLEERLVIYRHSEAAEEADLMQLCDLLKNMRSWWD